jgi:membrane protein
MSGVGEESGFRTGLGEFFSDLKDVLGPAALRRVGRKVWADDCLAVAAQLAYFALLSLFPLLMSIVAVAGLIVTDPESVLETLAERMGSVLPEDAVALLTDYVDRTLRGRSSAALFFAALLVLGSGSAASQAIVKAANRAYGVRESRPFWKIWGLSVLMLLGIMLLVAALALAAFSPEAVGYAARLVGLPDVFSPLWDVLRWVLAFVAVTLALAVLFYLAPNAGLPFKWITPGGFAATVLMLAFSAALNFYVANVARYDQVYGQLAAVIVLMLWLYVTGLMVLVGIEMNAGLARVVEERKGIRLVESEAPAEES